MRYKRSEEQETRCTLKSISQQQKFNDLKEIANQLIPIPQ